MTRLLKHPHGADTKLICGGLSSTEIPVHSSILTARSNILAEMILPRNESSARNAKVDTTEDKATDTQNSEEKVIDKENEDLKVRGHPSHLLKND